MTEAKATFDERWHVDLTPWEFPEVSKLPEPMRAPILQDISEVIDELIRGDTCVELTPDRKTPDRNLMVSVYIPLGPAQDEWVIGKVPFDAMVGYYLDDYGDDVETMRGVASQLEEAAKKIRDAAGIEAAGEAIERPTRGASLVARLSIDGNRYDAPLTKIEGGYEVTIPAVGVLKLPVIIEAVTEEVAK